jgi:hypothetical protein
MRDYYEQTDILQKKGKYQNGSKTGTSETVELGIEPSFFGS